MTKEDFFDKLVESFEKQLEDYGVAESYNVLYNKRCDSIVVETDFDPRHPLFLAYEKAYNIIIDGLELVYGVIPYDVLDAIYTRTYKKRLRFCIDTDAIYKYLE